MDEDISTSRLSEIAGEVMDLIKTPDIFKFLQPTHGLLYPKLDERLKEVLDSVNEFKTIELAMYLRTSSSRRSVLTNWKPLLEATIKQTTARGQPTKEIFVGLM